MKQNQNDAHRYDDIIQLPRPVSATRKPMARAARAAQFMPFSALTGYGEAVQETARLTAEKVELSEEEMLFLSGRIRLLQEHIAEHPAISVTYFVPDKRKKGGAYKTVSGNAEKVEDYQRRIVFEDKTAVPIDDMIRIDGKLFDLLELDG